MVQLEALRELDQEGALAGPTRAWLHKSGVLSSDCLTGLAGLVDQAPQPSRDKNTSPKDYVQRLAWPPAALEQAEELLIQLGKQRDKIAAALFEDITYVYEFHQPLCPPPFRQRE